MELTIYYSLLNCGDGSARPELFDTEELADWHQEHLYDGEGWAEPCTGSIIVEGDNLRCSELTTKEGHYLELLLDYRDDEDDKRLRKFCSAFFPDGLPEFTVAIINCNHYGVFVEDQLVYEQFAFPEKRTNAKGVQKLLKRLTKGFS